MKNLFKILIIVLGISPLLSEEYICSGSLEGFSTYTEDKKSRTTSLQRVNDQFFVIDEFSRTYFDILEETTSFIILTHTYTSPSLYVYFINKDNNTYSEYFLMSGEESTKPMNGVCIKK